MKKKRLLAALLTLAMLLSMVPPGIVAEAADTVYNTAGQTYSQATNDPSTLPAITGSGLVWAGPEHTSTCTTSEHTHSNSCYEMTCGGTSWSHWRHTNSCYNFNNMTCTRNEHQHSSSCPSTYTWTVQSTTNAQWRNWWPIYWGYDEGSTIDYMTAVSGVIANGQTIAFTTSEVADGTALKAVADGVTGNVEDVLKGVTVEMTSGYYITSYRFVCGNHTGCGVTSYDERSHTANTAGDYTPTLVIVPSTEEFDHWANVGDLTTNSNGGRNTNYIPWDAPAYNASNLYSEISGNDVYPFYLLLEVQQDTTTYNVRYNWGELTSSMGSIAVPDEDNDLLRNATHTVEAPSAEAIAKAAELGYVFQGWKVQATGYDANAMVQAGNTVTIYGSDITLVAQWKKEVTVSYVYQGEVPTGAAAVPATKVYVEGDSVTVEPTPAAVTGYKFTGWTAPSGITVSDGKFTMPGTPVQFVGTWAKDDSQTRTVTYTVKYWFNGAQNLTEHPDVTKTETVWVNETGVAFDTSLKKEIEGWKYIFSDPENLALPITDGSVIHLYYAGNDPEIAVDKSVTYEDGTPITGKVQVGDTLKYTITITNKGNHIFTEPVLVKDTANGTGNITFSSKDSSTIVSHERKADTTVGSTVSQYIDHFTFSFSASAPFNVGDSYKAVYYYTVTAEDAGNTIRNTAYWNDQDPNTDIGADSTETEVENQYTLTINLHNENGQQGTWTSDPMNESASYSITIGDTHSPKSIVVGGITYAYDYAEDSLSGTMANGDVVVDLYYAKDMNGDEGSDKPDGTPDKYQVTIVYYAYTGGSIAPGALTREVVEIYKNGQLSETGDVVATGSTAVPSPNNVFNQWTVHEQGHASTYDLDLTAQFSNHTLYSVKGGKVYIYTAYFDSKEVTIDKAVDKNLANVGDTLHYEIHVHNTGSADLTNIVVKDTLGYTDDTPFTGKIVYDPAGQPAIQEGEPPIEVTYDAAAGTFTINSLPAGRFVNIIYTYTVQAVDSGKTLRNTAVVTNDDVDKNDDTVETPVNTKYYTLHYRNISENQPATATIPANITDIKLNESRNLTAASTTETTRNSIPGEWKFVGWYKDEALTDGPITKYENITSDVAVYANWEFTPGSYDYTIEYYYDLVLDETKTETGTAVYGTKIETYTEKPRTGDVLDKVENLPLTVTDKESSNVIRVYYGKDVIGPDNEPDKVPDYKQAVVEYVSADTNKGTLEGPVYQVFTLPQNTSGDYVAVENPKGVTTHPVNGYVFDGWTDKDGDVENPFDELTLKGGDHIVFTANWTERTNLEYVVRYYEKGTTNVVHPATTVHNQKFGTAINVADLDKPNVTGYTYDSAAKNSITISTNAAENEIILYYVRNQYPYTIHYYFDGVEKEALRLSGDSYKAAYGSTIELTDAQKNAYLTYEGVKYVIDFVGNHPLVISDNTDHNYIHVHYVKDMLDDPDDNTTDGDGIPDYKQAVIEFVNSAPTKGTIALEGGSTAENITQVFTLPQVIMSGTTVYQGDEIPATVVATRATGHYFSGWDGGTYDEDPFVVHTLKGGDHITYTATWGDYNGLFYVIRFYEKDSNPPHTIHPQVTILENVTEGMTVKADDIYEDYPIQGFTYCKDESNKLVITAPQSDANVINLYYVRNSYNYTIHYYFDGVENEEFREEHSAKYGETITLTDAQINQHIGTDYTLDFVGNDPLVISYNKADNFIHVHYTKDVLDDEDDNTTDGDGIPDYKQAVIEFVNSDSTKGTLEGKTVQVFTLPQVIDGNNIVYKGDELPEGVKTLAAVGYDFTGWTDKYEDEVKDPFVIHTLEGGDHIVYTANWDGRTDLSYTVRYYEKGTTNALLPSTTVSGVSFKQIINSSSITAPTIIGYTFESYSAETLTINSVNPDENVIILYYTRGSFEYTVHYFYDNVEDKSATETATAAFAEVVTTYTDKVKKGYILDRVENLPLTVTEVKANNFIHVHYKKDPNDTKTLSYTVEYYVDGVLDELETDKFFAQVWIGDADILTVEETAINTEDKYPHYKCVSTDPEEIPDTIADGGVIKVYYVKDEDDTKEVDYTVKFYKEGELVDEDTEIITQDVWAGGSDYAIVDLNLIDPEKYEGYDLDHTDPETVPGAVVSGTVIKVYYVEEPQLPPPTSIFGTVILTKVDANDTTTPLTGVVFELYDANEALVGTYTTDKNGQIKVENLLEGDYFWKEVLPAQGYTLDATAQEFTVYGGETTEVEMTNKRTPVPEIFTGDHFAYVIGYTDGNVKPTGNITRAEVATIFFRMLDEDVRTENSTKENSFSDVNAGDWFNHAVSTMAAMGVINGYPDGTFRPNAPITRAEFATLASRFDMDGDASDTIFKDIYEHWGRREINIAANNGWVLGYEDGTFQPDKHITRAEAMTMVNRVLQRIPQSTADLLDDMIVWPDNADTTKWYYLSVQEATNSHFYDRKDNGYETWTELREARNWAELEK